MIGVVLLERGNPHSKLVQEEANGKGDHRREDGNQPVFRARWDSLVRQFEGEPRTRK